jgi:CPA1 family monovalent cation:H+ antiporter
MSDGSAFPDRDLAIVLAMCVILVSLLLATAALPVLSRGLDVRR